MTSPRTKLEYHLHQLGYSTLTVNENAALWNYNQEITYSPIMSHLLEVVVVRLTNVLGNLPAIIVQVSKQDSEIFRPI